MTTGTKKTTSSESKSSAGRNQSQYMNNMMQQYQEWMNQMSSQFDNVMSCHNTFVETANKASQQWQEQTQKNFSDNASSSKNFFGCNNLEDMVKFQSEVWQQNLSSMMEMFGKQMDATFQSMNEATNNLNAATPFANSKANS